MTYHEQSNAQTKPDLVISLKDTKVIDIHVKKTSSAPSQPFEAAIKDLVIALRTQNLQTELARHKNDTILILLTSPPIRLKKEDFRSRLQDWLHGVGPNEFEPARVQSDMLGMTSAHRLKLVYQILSNNESQDGVDVYASGKTWKKYLQSIDALHDREYNEAWVKSWSTKWMLTDADLEMTRHQFGESVAMYFAFLQEYFIWLAAPALLGVIVHMVMQQEYSILYGISISIWSILFIEHWARKEQILARRWDIANCSKNEQEHPDFKPDVVYVDSVTGETVKVANPWKTILDRSLVVPTVGVLVLMLALIICVIYVSDVLIGQIYHGPFKDIISLMPTVAFAGAMSQFSAAYKQVAIWLTKKENHQTAREFDEGLTSKMFIVNFLGNFSSALFYGLFYVPFSHVATGALERYFMITSVKVSPEAFRTQVISFVMTGQVIGFCQELIVPMITRYLYSQVVKATEKAKAKIDDLRNKEHTSTFHDDGRFVQLDLPEYFLQDDYNEMINQFGYVTLFATAWPLTSLAAFVNNWFELRSDAAKICLNMRRPIPRRAESIGTWLTNMRVLSWMGVMLNTLWILMYGPQYGGSWSSFEMLMAVVVAEHVFFLAAYIIRAILRTRRDATDQQLHRNEWRLRQKYLSMHTDDSLHDDGTSVTSAKFPSVDATVISSEVQAQLESLFKSV